jgi:hypothetical protein
MGFLLQDSLCDYETLQRCTPWVFLRCRIFGCCCLPSFTYKAVHQLCDGCGVAWGLIGIYTVFIRCYAGQILSHIISEICEEASNVPFEGQAVQASSLYIYLCQSYFTYDAATLNP